MNKATLAYWIVRLLCEVVDAFRSGKRASAEQIRRAALDLAVARGDDAAARELMRTRRRVKRAVSRDRH